MKRSPMKRSYTVKRYRDTGPSQDVWLPVVTRDGFGCVRCGAAIRGVRGQDFHVHHRRVRGMGGSRREDTNSPANLLTLCPDCHVYVHANVAEARDNGWLLWQDADPQTCAVLVDQQRRFMYLTDDFAYSDNPPERAA